MPLDRSYFTFNTADDGDGEETLTSTASGLQITSPTYQKQTGTGAETETILAYTAHAPTGSGSTDWRAGGWWLRLADDIGAGSITRVEAGAFVDGPVLRGSLTLPKSGNATYKGDARSTKSRSPEFLLTAFRDRPARLRR